MFEKSIVNAGAFNYAQNVCVLLPLLPLLSAGIG